MEKRAFWIPLAVLAIANFVIPASVLAQTASTPLTLINPLGKITTLQGVIAAFTNFLITIAIPLTAIMALIGGFQMITSSGNPEKFASGRKTLLYAAIGFAVVVLASGIVSIIKNLLGA